jgi:HEPN domain-containing protein
MTPATRPWVRKAEGDFRVAQREMLVVKGASYDVVCFHCQQCIEKYLKARLTEAACPFPKIHDLARLMVLVIAIEPEWARYSKKFAAPTDFAVDARYPGFTSTKSKARSAMQKCEEL